MSEAIARKGPTIHRYTIDQAYELFGQIAAKHIGTYTRDATVRHDVDRVAELLADVAAWRTWPKDQQDPGGPYIQFEMGNPDPDARIPALHRYSKIARILRRYFLDMEITAYGFHIVAPIYLNDADAASGAKTDRSPLPVPPDGFIIVQ